MSVEFSVLGVIRLPATRESPQREKTLHTAASSRRAARDLLFGFILTSGF
jgi:hypothetical protein